MHEESRIEPLETPSLVTSQTIAKLEDVKDDETEQMLNQVRELKLKNERLENSNRQLEEKIKKLAAEKAERKPEFKGDSELKKENESLKEEIKKALTWKI